MSIIIYDNLAAFSISLLACAYAWLYGGIVGDALLPTIPWITVFLVEVMLCFPQRHFSETTYDARRRVWRAMRRDPVMWTALAFTLMLMVPFVNKGLCPLCDYPAIVAGASEEPPVPFLPWCVNRLHHMNVVMWFVPALTALLATRHALLKRGKRTVLEMIVWNGFILAILGFVQNVCKAQAPLWADLPGPKAYFFSTFGYPNMGGDYFTTLFALAIGLWRWRFDEHRIGVVKKEFRKERKMGPGAFWATNYMLIPAVVLFFAAIATLSRAAILIAVLLAAVFFLHSFITVFASLPRGKKPMAIVSGVIGVAAVAALATFFAPSDLQQEVQTLNTTEVLDRVTGRGQYHNRVAFEIFKEHPLFGVGGWSYRHLCVPRMRRDEVLQMVGGVNVHNDHLQFMTEHGIAGYGCLVAIVIMVLWPLGKIWKALVNAASFMPKEMQPPRPIQIFALPAPAFCILAAATGTVVHAFGDCPFRSPAVLSLFFIELAAMYGFLPSIHENKR